MMTLRLPVLFIIITVVIDAMGIGLIMPVMPDLVREVAGTDLANAALWGGVLTTVFAVMQFVFGPIIGNLSDAFGRRPVLLISLVAMAFDYLVMAVAGTMWLLILTRIIGGITAATHSTASAYMADISDKNEKSANFGLIGAGFGVGFVLGPLIGGVLAEYGTRAPFYAAAGLALLNAAFGYFVLRETVTLAKRRPFQWRRANPFGALRSIGGFIGVAPLLWVYFFYTFANTVYPVIWAYFTTERFGWSPGLIGISLAVYGLSLAVVQGGLVRPAIRYFGEAKTVLIGLTIDLFSLVILGFISSGTLALALIPITALGGLGAPPLQGILSRNVDDNAQGELQGVLTSLNAISMIIAPLLITTIFATFSRPGAVVYLPGAPFLLAAVLLAIGLTIFATQRHRT